MIKTGWRIIPIIVFILLSFFLWKGLSLNPHALPSVKIGKPFPDFTLPQLQEPGHFFNSAQLFGSQVVLLNVWASWCSACTEEQVTLMQLAREGVAIYGLNYKDKSADALQWLAQWGNPYKVVLQDRDGKVAIDLGVYGTPETFLIDKKGIIRYRHAGQITQELWQQEILPLIKKLDQMA